MTSWLGASALLLLILFFLHIFLLFPQCHDFRPPLPLHTDGERQDNMGKSKSPLAALWKEEEELKRGKIKCVSVCLE